MYKRDGLDYMGYFKNSFYYEYVCVSVNGYVQMLPEVRGIVSP